MNDGLTYTAEKLLVNLVYRAFAYKVLKVYYRWGGKLLIVSCYLG